MVDINISDIAINIDITFRPGMVGPAASVHICFTGG